MYTCAISYAFSGLVSKINLINSWAKLEVIVSSLEVILTSNVFKLDPAPGKTFAAFRLVGNETLNFHT